MVEEFAFRVASFKDEGRGGANCQVKFVGTLMHRKFGSYAALDPLHI